MDAKLFKTFTPLVNLATSKTAIQHVFDQLHDREATDPVGSQWRALGFIPPIADDEFMLSLDGAGWLACVQINERNLPGAVIREKVLEKALAIGEAQGRKPGKKEIAQIKDDVLLELLPKAFIRRKLVPIMFVGKRVYVFSSSAKVVDDVLGLLMYSAEMDDMFRPHFLLDMVERNVDSELTQLAKTAVSDNGDEENYLETSDYCVLKGVDKQTITVKDKDLGSADLEDLWKQDYSVTKLGLKHFEPGLSVEDSDSSFILSDKLIFSRFTFNGLHQVVGIKGQKDAAETFQATAWLAAKTIDRVVDTVISVMGGLRPTAKPKEDERISMTKAAATIEDDEL